MTEQNNMAQSYLSWLRQFVGHQKIISTGAAAIIRDARGRFLLQKRSDVGLWGIPGGGQELGERIDDTLRREVREEVGLDVEPRRIINLYTSPRVEITFPNGDQIQPYVVRFECDIVGGALKKDGDEVLAIGWFAFDQLPPMTPLARQAVEDAARFRGEAFFDDDLVIASCGAAKQSPTRDVEIASAQTPRLAMTNYVRWLRQYVGHAKIILPGAAGIVRDAQGRALLQRRRDNGLWGFPGGLIELGESAADTIRREFRAEVGLQIEPRRLIGVYTSPEFDRGYPNGDQSQLFASFFECEVIGGELKMQAEEVLELGWFDLNADLPPMIPCCAAKARDARIFTGAAFWR
ncbi:MAG: NUDIX domain-containing protein [Chloroflexi bacterium]|nr:NUDIX domain-containing protein [Chloroflexota bacterium]